MVEVKLPISRKKDSDILNTHNFHTRYIGKPIKKNNYDQITNYRQPW